MISRTVTIGLLAAGCVTAAAGGSYLAVRQNAADRAPAAAPATPGVAETEAVVSPSTPAATPAQPVEAPAATDKPALPALPEPRREEPRRLVQPPRRPQARTASQTPPPAEPVAPPTSQPAPVTPLPVAERPADVAPPVEPPARVEPALAEVTVPASAVIGLEIETSVTSEQAQVEDRVDARVTRDVFADGRLAIPAGSKLVGGVTVVERGGKIKERARLGVRFHTLVLADGRQLPLRTETIFREGSSPGAESSRKIGGAAIGGAVLGAILGGGKGAVAGASVGAAGGTAAVMAGGRNAATLTSGSVVTVRLSAPVTFEVEKDSQL